MKFTARILAGLMLILALALPQSAQAVLDRAICSSADKGGVAACSGPVTIASANEEINHAYDLGIINLTSVAGTNTITATAIPPITAYIDGAHYDLRPVVSNTGAVTLAISGLPAKALTGIAGSALIGGELVSNARMLVTYDGSSDKFKLESQAAGAVVFGASGGSHSSGLVPDPGSTAGTTRYLREDGNWTTTPQQKTIILLASTSGTSIDFTGANAVPSWVTRITLVFNGVSTSATSLVQVQIGPSATPETTTYASKYDLGGGGSATATSGFIIGGNTAAWLRTGQLTLINTTGNVWVENHMIGDQTQTSNTNSGGIGVKTTASTINILRITTVNGTDTFDAGSITAIFES